MMIRLRPENETKNQECAIYIKRTYTEYTSTTYASTVTAEHCLI